ncbi:MAG: DUF2868 domain-containing protein [Giesbergeria sp.]
MVQRQIGWQHELDSTSLGVARLSDEGATSFVSRGARAAEGAAVGMTGNARTRLESVWVAQAVQCIEEQGPLDDTQALARALRSQGGQADRLLERAWLLGERLGLVEQLARWREAAWLLLLLAAAAVLALANGLLFAVLADGRTINAMSALISALGLHLLTLFFWLVSLALGGASGAGSAASLSLGRLLTGLALRLPFWRGPQAAPMARAGMRLLARERLTPWAFGLVSHVVWALGLLFMLIGLMFAFSFREYQLTWESTILGPDWFATFARVSGALPAMLGVPIPHLLDTTQTAGVWPAREAAWWLLACVALYGLLPRAVCALVCWGVVNRAARRIDLPLNDPYYQQLLARLQALEPAQVSDAERSGAKFSMPPMALGSYTPGVAVLGFELPENAPWPPAALAEGAALLIRIDGSMAEQNEVYRQLATLRPEALLVLCDAAASPDRGTARFLREAGASARRCVLVLCAPPNGATDETATGAERWRAWMGESHLAAWAVVDSVDAAARWAGDSV